jgi:WD40 repeat protein
LGRYDGIINARELFGISSVSCGLARRQDSRVRLWDVKTGVLLKTLIGHSNWVRSVAFSPDSKVIASGSDDETVILWDAKTGEMLHTLRGYSGWVTSVVFSPDGKLVVSRSGFGDERVKFWDTQTGTIIPSSEGYSNLATPMAFSPDDKVVHSLIVSNDWVTEGGVNILWLPPDYRATCVASRNGIIVLGHLSGRISILECKEGLNLI